LGLKRFQPENFYLECTTVWSFPKRGNWATHRSDYQGNWSPQVVRNLILRYSQEGDTILDQMVGGGTTLKEDIIKVQHNCKATGFWVKKSKLYNFLLLIMHEHLFVFQKSLKELCLRSQS